MVESASRPPQSVPPIPPGNKSALSLAFESLLGREEEKGEGGGHTNVGAQSCKVAAGNDEGRNGRIRLKLPGDHFSPLPCDPRTLDYGKRDVVVDRSLKNGRVGREKVEEASKSAIRKSVGVQAGRLRLRTSAVRPVRV